MNPPKKKREKRVDEKATNDWCVCFIPDGLGEETDLYLAESFCDEEIKSFIRSHFISREKVEEVIEKIMESYNHNSIPSYTADLEEGCSICIKNQAFLDLRQELLE